MKIIHRLISILGEPMTLTTQYSTGNTETEDDFTMLGLVDPSYYSRERDLTDYDPRKPFVIPEPDHLLVIRRSFTESEKEDIWNVLEMLRQANQLDKHTNSEAHKQKAVDLGIHLFDFEYTKGIVRAKCKK